MPRFLRIANKEIILSIAVELQYRFRLIVWLVSDALQPLMFCILWVAVGKSTNLNVSQNEIVLYYFFVALVVKIVEDWSIVIISDEIYTGKFSRFLIKPFNYLIEAASVNIASKLVRIALILPIWIIILFTWDFLAGFTIDLTTLLMLLTSIVPAIIITFLLGNIFALMTVFVKNIISLRSLYLNITSFLSGEYLPLILLPIGIFNIIKWLPFRYILSFPIETILGIQNNEYLFGITTSFVWCLILFVLYKVTYKFAIIKFESEGV